MSRAPKKPANVEVHPVHARVIRGPRADGCWYWQARICKGEKGGARVICSVWKLKDEIGPYLIALIAEKGLDKPAEDESPAEIRTVQDLLEAWLGSRTDAKDLSAATQRAAKASAARLVGPKEARTPLAPVLVTALDRSHLERYRDTTTGAESTIARDLKTLRSAWKWGRDLGHAPNHGLPSLARAGKTKKPKPVYTRFTPSEAEVAAILARLAHRKWVQKAVLLLYATGARIGEVATLQWGAIAPYSRAHVLRDGRRLVDLDDDERVNWEARDCASIVVDGKTGPREIPLHPAVQAQVQSWRPKDADTTALIFGVSSNSVTTRVQAALADTAEALKMPRLSPNGLRRAAERALYRTREIDIAASLMGHSPETAMSIYRQVTDGERHRVVRAAGLGIPTAAPADVIEGPWRKEEGS